MKSAFTPFHVRSDRGHTLVEILIASSASLLVVGGAMWLIVAGVRTSARSTNAIVNDLTQWGIASRLWIDSRIANGITIYQSAETSKVKRWLRSVVNDRGNYVVFSLSATNVLGNTYFTRLSGYEYDPGSRKIYRFDYAVSAADQAAETSLEDILNTRRTDIKATYIVIASLVDPLDSQGVFLCRTAGTAASFACRITSGDEQSKTLKNKTIEATFYVRS